MSVGTAYILPQEVLVQVFAFLEPDSLCSVSMVCNLWHEVADDKHLWKRFLPQEKESVKEKYILLMREEMQLQRADYNRILPWLKEISNMEYLSGHKIAVRKVQIVGDSGVGKTVFIRRCAGKPFVASYKSTVGVEYTIMSSEKGEVQVWDIGDAEPYGRIRQYWSGTHLVVLMFDLQRSSTVDSMLQFLSTCVKYWAPMSEHAVKYIVIGGKADLQSIDTDAWTQIKGQCKDIAPIEDFFWVSSKADIDIDAAKSRIFDLLFREHDWVNKQMRYEGMVYLPGRETWERMARGVESSSYPNELTYTNGCSIQ